MYIGGFVGLIILLVILAFVLGIWGGRMDAMMKKMIYIVAGFLVLVVVVVGVLWLLQATGIWDGTWPTVHTSRHGDIVR